MTSNEELNWDNPKHRVIMRNWDDWDWRLSFGDWNWHELMEVGAIENTNAEDVLFLKPFQPKDEADQYRYCRNCGSRAGSHSDNELIPCGMMKILDYKLLRKYKLNWCVYWEGRGIKNGKFKGKNFK